ncbi:extracellular solute-binding protein [Azospirillum doebereinerae]|nr:extracellular solute-binding protein [Azospirillum doebereinerae]
MTRVSTGSFMVAATGVVAALALSAPARAELPALPKSAQVITIVDAAGNLALTQKAIENYRKDHPDVVSRFVLTKAPSPELPGKIKAQQAAGRLDIDMILVGPDGLAAGIEQKIWEQTIPQYTEKFPNLEKNYLPGAADMQKAFNGYGVVVNYYPSGPLIEYAPERVKNPPKSAEELLAYCKANPNKFAYARPANSGPGRTFIMGLPYILGDKDPKDPINGWDKTWAYLKELNSCIEYYPSGTGATMKEFGEGTRDMVVSTTGWDINPRVLGIVPKSAEVTALKGFHWVVDAHYMVVPKGLSKDKLAVVLDVMAHLLKPDQQAYGYDEGYFYPGPAVKDVPLSMAPPESQEAIKNFGRPEYEALIAGAPLERPLDADKLVAAFRKWDEEIGAAKTK